MRRSLLLLLAASFLTSAALAAEDGRDEQPPKKSFVSRIFGVFGGSKKKDASRRIGRQLDVTMDVSPMPVRLSDTRQLEVVMKLSNRSKKIVMLDFPTTQRIELLIRTGDGRLVTQWSEDHAFAAVVGAVTINPGERLQYTERIATRDLEAGKPYVLEAFLPKYPDLHAEEKFVPEP